MNNQMCHSSPLYQCNKQPKLSLNPIIQVQGTTKFVIRPHLYQCKLQINLAFNPHHTISWNNKVSLDPFISVQGTTKLSLVPIITMQGIKECHYSQSYRCKLQPIL